MKIRMLLLAMIPSLMVVGCGMESEPKDDLRGQQVEPCQPDDCIPLGALIEDDCPPGTELVASAECVEADGECVWEQYEACVPVEESGGGDPPPPDDVPPPSEAPPRPIRPS